MTDTTGEESVAAPPEEQTTDAATTTPATGADIARAELSQLGALAGNGGSTDIGLDLILDVSVTVSLEFGRTSMSVRDLLQLNQGSVVEFDRRVGEPLDLLVNGTLLARGELVVVDERFGIRLLDVVSPDERIERLN